MRRVLLLAVSVLVLGMPGRAAAAPVLGVNISGPPLNTAIASGAHEVRMFVFWNELEPAKGRFDQAIVDRYLTTVREASAAGLRVSFVFTGAPDWASRQHGFGAPPTHVADYASALARFAALPGLAGHHTAYEVWNEPDASAWWEPEPDAADYARLFRAAAPALRRADPTAEVVLGPTTGANWPWIASLYKHHINGTFDAAAVHLDTACLVTAPDVFFKDHGRVSQYVFLGVIEVLATLRAHGDDKPLRVSEYGWSSTQPSTGAGPLCDHGQWAGQKPSGVSTEQQAVFLAQGYHCLAQIPGIEAATWFMLADLPNESRDEYRHYGLLTAAGAHKPAWDAFTAIAARGDQLSGPCGDFTAPSVTIAAPTAGAVYSRTLLISASARDDGGPARISLYADGHLIRNFTRALANDKVVSIDWQGAKRLSLGPHRITVAAVDSQGNEQRQSVEVRRVTPAAQLARGPVSIALQPVQCAAHRRCVLRGSAGNASGMPLPGKVRAEWQHRSGRGSHVRWRTRHRWTRPAGKPFTFRQKLALGGTWRVRVRYLPPGRLRGTASRWTVFGV